MSNIKNEKGLTLVEVLAAIVILSIIFTSIISILTHTARTNRTSQEIIDATYVAQQEMEFIYKLSEMNSGFIPNHGYSQQTTDDEGWTVYHKDSKDTNFKIVIKEQEVEDSLVRVLVLVYEASDHEKEQSRAQMETLLSWRSD